MQTTRTNKFIMAFLATVFVVMTTGILSDSLFYSPVPEKAGFAIEVAEAPAAGGGEAPAKEEVSIATLLQSADPARGQAVFKRCAACHTGDKGGANKVGPNQWNLIGRKKATEEGFSYSSALQKLGGEWTYEDINHMIFKPQSFARGTKMAFAGLPKEQDRADVIAYLRTMHDDPKPPLP